MGGQFENQYRAYSRLAAVVPLALGIMLLLLFAACGKFRQAALMMCVVPLALFGGMLALNVRGMTLNVSSAVGFIALIGVAIQNGVIMISHINNLRTRGRDFKESVITGTKHRFRPILMTATVAVLGLLPAPSVPASGRMCAPVGNCYCIWLAVRNRYYFVCASCPILYGREALSRQRAASGSG